MPNALWQRKKPQKNFAKKYNRRRAFARGRARARRREMDHRKSGFDRANDKLFVLEGRKKVAAASVTKICRNTASLAIFLKFLAIFLG